MKPSSTQLGMDPKELVACLGRHGPVGPLPRAGRTFASGAGDIIWVDNASGVKIRDLDGREYVDFSCGGEMPLGYNYRLEGEENGQFVLGKGLESPVRVRLMHKLAEIVPGGMNRRVLLCESGREALARAVSLACRETGRSRVAYLSDSDADSPDFGVDVAAVVVHPLDYRLTWAKQFCDRSGALLIDDESRLAPGITGRMFAIEHQGIRPHLYVEGRGLAAGASFGACITGSSKLRWGDTETNASVANCTAALGYINLLESGLLEAGREKGANLARRLAALPGCGTVFHCAGVGMCQWLKFQSQREAARFFIGCRERGLLLSWSGSRAVAMVVPLVAGDSEIEAGLAVMHNVLTNVQS